MRYTFEEEQECVQGSSGDRGLEEARLQITLRPFVCIRTQAFRGLTFASALTPVVSVRIERFGVLACFCEGLD